MPTTLSSCMLYKNNFVYTKLVVQIETESCLSKYRGMLLYFIIFYGYTTYTSQGLSKLQIGHSCVSKRLNWPKQINKICRVVAISVTILQRYCLQRKNFNIFITFFSYTTSNVRKKASEKSVYVKLQTLMW